MLFSLGQHHCVIDHLRAERRLASTGSARSLTSGAVVPNLAHHALQLSTQTIQLLPDLILSLDLAKLTELQFLTASLSHPQLIDRA
jgi:hypothetical protein